MLYPKVVLIGLHKKQWTMDCMVHPVCSGYGLSVKYVLEARIVHYRSFSIHRRARADGTTPVNDINHWFVLRIRKRLTDKILE